SGVPGAAQAGTQLAVRSTIGEARASPQQRATDAQHRNEDIHQPKIDELPELPHIGTRSTDSPIDLLFTAHVDEVIPQGERIHAVEEKIQIAPRQEVAMEHLSIP